MLARDENERVTRVGRGTPMGEAMRRYWIPALLGWELPEPDCPPVRVKLLGEELVAFRDSRGCIGLLVEQPDAPPRVAKGHQLLAQQLDADGRAIRLGQLPAQKRRDPVPPHRLAHGGASADAGDSLVLVACQHAQALLALPGALVPPVTG